MITRTPKPGLLRARRTGNAVACFGANPTEAWAKHQAAIADFGVSRGLLMGAETLDDAVGLFRLAGSTYRRRFMREMVLLAPVVILEISLAMLAGIQH